MHDRSVDVAIIGGGQSALAVAYFLRRLNLRFVILDQEPAAGGAWRYGWDSLTLFSPAQWSSLPGWPMPPTTGYPTREDVVDYLRRYEGRYDFQIERPVRVISVRRHEGGRFDVDTDAGVWRATTVVNASGTRRFPHVPDYPGQDVFAGVQIHSASYKNADPFRSRQVLVVGGGNSGAQIFAEVSKVSDAKWVTQAAPVFLADDVDGRVLFERATARWQAISQGQPEPDLPGGFGDIVMVPPVKAARDRGVLTAVRPFDHFVEHGVAWADGQQSKVDAVIWCTGFRPALQYLEPLDILDSNGRVELDRLQSTAAPNLWFAGYGDWTGFASATLVGITRSARAIVHGIAAARESSTSNVSD